MLEFKHKTGAGCSFRIWLNEFPSGFVVPPPAEQLTEKFIPAVTKPASRSMVAVEMLQPRGGSFLYGLLGGEFFVHEDIELRVVVPYGVTDAAATYANSLAGRLDHVAIGGRRDFASAVLAGVRELRDGLEALPAGRLCFTCMAHGAVGSAAVGFHVLAKAVVRLLHRSEPPGTLEEIVPLLQQ